MSLLALVLSGCGTKAPEDTAACEVSDGTPVCDSGFTITARAERALSAPITIPRGTGNIVVGDLAGSGAPQIYAATNSTLTRLDGEGWATATDIWAASGTDIIPILADLTGDGIIDLVLGLPGSDAGAGQVEVFPGPVMEPLTWDSPHFELQGEHGEGEGIVAADLNGDGLLDLVSRAAGRVWMKPGPIRLDEPFGTRTDTEFTWDPTLGVSSFVGDFDGDGTEDLLFSLSYDPGGCTGWVTDLRLVPGPLAPGVVGIEEAERVFVLPDDAADALRFEDLDEDGTIDLVLPMATGEIAVYPGPLQPGEHPAFRFSTPGLAFLPGDFDGDGVLDLVQAVLGIDTPLVSHGPLAALPVDMLTTCTFTADEAWTEGTAFPDAAWVGDLDGDARADAVIASTALDGSGAIQILLGTTR